VRFSERSKAERNLEVALTRKSFFFLNTTGSKNTHWTKKKHEMVFKPLPCFIAAALIGGILMTIVRANRQTLTTYVKGLTTEQIQMHKFLSAARLRIWLVGLVLGMMVASVLAPRLLKRGATDVLKGCAFAGIVMTVNYFTYMLWPKPGYMVEVLREDQIPAWHAVGKMMRGNYHLGMLVGVTALVLAGSGLL
jgi:hypothetical protein